MCNAYKKALAAPTKTAAEAILKDHGLHKIIVCFSIMLSINKFHLNLSKNAFWSIANSDPYRAVSYDTLHSDDIGKWGKHLWPLLLDVLGNLRKKGVYSNKYVDMNIFTKSQVTHFLPKA